MAQFPRLDEFFLGLSGQKVCVTMTRTKIDLEPRIYRNCQISIGKNNVVVSFEKVEVADVYGRLEVAGGPSSKWLAAFFGIFIYAVLTNVCS